MKRGNRYARNKVEDVMIGRIDRKYGRRRKLDALINEELQKREPSKKEKPA